jgi:ribosome-associated protein
MNGLRALDRRITEGTISLKKPAKKSAKKAVKKAAPKSGKKPVKKTARTVAKKAVKSSKLAVKAKKTASLKKVVTRKAPTKKVAKTAAKKTAKKTAKKIVKAKAAVASPSRKTAKKAVVKKAVVKKALAKKAVKTAMRKTAVRKPVAILVAPVARTWPPLVEAILKQLDDSKAEAIVTIDVSRKSTVADTMVVASGRSNRHVNAIADQVVEALEKTGKKNIRVEGVPQCDWVLVDAGDVMIHIFRPEVRSFYNLEKLWSEHAPQ